MFLKVMNDENSSDKDQSKGYEMIECASVHFTVHPDQGPIAGITLMDGKQASCLIPANAYVLNSDGKTIDCWAPNSGGPVRHLMTEGVDPANIVTSG